MTALECMPLSELENRHARVRAMMAARLPEAGGLLVTEPLTLYYLTGTLATGVFWLPLEGEPVLCVRKGRERARLESPLCRIESFRSYKDLPELCGGFPPVVGVDMDGFTWAQAEMLRTRLDAVKRFVAADDVLARVRAVKTPWELAKLRLAGARHNHCLRELLPPRIHPGMSEREIGRVIWDIFLEHGHCGLIRLSRPNEGFLGHISAGDSGLYATGFDGPLGTRGMHPATPYMGDAGTVWKDLLTLDVGFALEGYNTDKTQTIWAGPVPDNVRRACDWCVAAQERAAAAMVPGAVPSRIWEDTVEFARASGQLSVFMGIGPDRVRFLGHGIGLRVDEFPAIAERFDEPLQVGMVMALEPKIVIPGKGMVGVEDTWEITPHGARCLTGEASLLVWEG